MIPPEQTECEFDKFFDLLGFKRVINDVGESPAFENADYVHIGKHIVVELKVLFKEHFVNGGVIDSLNAIVVQPISIDNEGVGQYVFSLPKKIEKISMTILRSRLDEY